MRSTRFAKLLSMVLTIAMVMTVLPLGALAETVAPTEATSVSKQQGENITESVGETEAADSKAAAPLALGAAPYAVTGGESPQSLALTVGGKDTLNYSGTLLSNGWYTNTPTGYSWSASPSGIVTLSGSGASCTATAVAVGTTTVSVTATRNRYTSRTEKFVITVTAATPAISGSSTVVAGNTATLTANFTPTAWTSSNEAVATVSASGVITAKTAGSTTITATDGAKTATLTLNVTAAEISGGTRVFTGGKLALTVNFTGAHWSSADETVATVDANGQVTALKAGTTTISATNGVATASTVVTVEAGIQISGGGKMFVGATQQLTANALEGETVAWSSNNDNVATVDQNGLLTAISAGQVTITATTANQGTASVTVLVEAYTVSLYSNYPDGAQKFTYDGQTGAGALVAAQNTYAVYQVGFNENFTFTSNLAFTCVNHEFVNWTENADGSGASYSAGDVLLIDKNVKLYAQWEPSAVTETEVSVSVSYYNTNNGLVKKLSTAGTYNSATGEITFQVHKNEQVGAPYNSGALCGWTIGGENVDLGGMCTTTSYTLSNGVYSVKATARYDTAPGAVVGTEVPGVSLTGRIDTAVVTSAVPDAAAYADAIVAAAGAKLVDNGAFLAKNYTLNIVPADLTVTPAGTMTVSASNVKKVYDGKAYGVSALSNVADAKIYYYNDASGLYDLTASPVITNVSDSVKTVKFTAVHANYTQVYGEATVTVTPETITVNMKDLTAVYGDQKNAMQPAYTAPSAVVAGETPKVEMTAEIAATVANRPNAGTYPDAIVAGNGAKLVDNGSFLAANYVLTVNPADLTVGKRPITITANENSKNYGAAEPQHTGAVTVGTILNNELTYTFARPSAGTTENPGVYGNAIQATVTSNLNDNYEVTTVNAAMTINVQVSYAYDGVQPAGAPALPETFYVAPAGAANTGDALALTGYGFNGWNAANVAIAADGSFTAPRDENVVLMGKFEADSIRYQVQYHWQNTDGLTYVNDPASMLFADADKDVAVTPAANTAAFIFNATKSNIAGNVGRVNDTLTLHLYYDRVAYTVSYLLDGAAYKTAQSHLNGKTVTTLAEPTQTGKRFTGWNSADMTGAASTYLPGTDFTMPASNVTLTGVLEWVGHTLSFDTDGAQSATPAAQTLHYGEHATNVADPVKAGHDFLYWTDGTTNYQSDALATGFTMPDADVVLKAVWQVHYHMLTYILDGAQLKLFEAVPYGASLTSGTYAMSIASDRINTFSGWTVENIGTAAPGTMPDEDLVLVGEMTPVIYRVYFWLSGGAYGTNTRYKTDKYTVGEHVGGHKVFQLEGYTFSGWSAYPAIMPDHDVDVYGYYTAIAEPTPEPTPTPTPTPEPEPTEEPIIEEIPDDDPALAGPANLAWALVNLILAILTAAASIVLLIGYIGKKKNEKTGKDIRKKGWTRLFSLITGIGAIVAFILTENMANPMRLVDRWTIVMAVIALIQLVVCFVAKRKEDDAQEVKNV